MSNSYDMVNPYDLVLYVFSHTVV